MGMGMGMGMGTSTSTSMSTRPVTRTRNVATTYTADLCWMCSQTPKLLPEVPSYKAFPSVDIVPVIRRYLYDLGGRHESHHLEKAGPKGGGERGEDKLKIVDKKSSETSKLVT